MSRKDKLKPVYKFLFHKHDIGFYRLAMAMLIPYCLSKTVCILWAIFMTFVLALVSYANNKGWNRIEGDER